MATKAMIRKTSNVSEVRCQDKSKHTNEKPKQEKFKCYNCDGRGHIKRNFTSFRQKKYVKKNYKQT